MKKIIYNLSILILSITFLFSTYKIISAELEYKKSENVYDNINKEIQIEKENSLQKQSQIQTETTSDIEYTENITEEKSEEPINNYPTEKINIKIDWENMNENIVAWIYISDTNISYPIMQADNNQYYLHHLYDGNYNSSGSIFIDYRNNNNFLDKNTIIYGHNMKNGTMFHGIKKYMEQEYADNHRYIYIVTREKTKIYYVIGCLSTSSKGEKDGYTAYQINPEDNTDWIKLSMQKSLIKTQIDDLKGNTITLSTCLTGNSDDKRCVVIAKEIN